MLLANILIPGLWEIPSNEERKGVSMTRRPYAPCDHLGLKGWGRGGTPRGSTRGWWCEAGYETAVCYPAFTYPFSRNRSEAFSLRISCPGSQPAETADQRELAALYQAWSSTFHTPSLSRPTDSTVAETCHTGGIGRMHEWDFAREWSRLPTIELSIPSCPGRNRVARLPRLGQW